MAFCSNCGNKLEDGAKFCPKCGQSISVESVPKQQREGNQSRKNNPKKKNSDETLGVWNILGLILSTLMILPLAFGFSGVAVAMLAILIFVAMVITIFKKEYRKYIGWILLASFILFFASMMAGISEDELPKPKPFEAVENGRAAYYLDKAHYENSDVQSIDMIIMYEGNSRKDCKVKGVNNQGHVYEENGKWEEKESPYSSNHFYYLDFKYFKLIIRSDSTVCYYKGKNEDENAIKTAWQNAEIGTIRDLDKNREDNISQNFQKKKDVDEYNSKPIKGSKDIEFVKDRIKGSIWTYTPTYSNPIPHWYRLIFSGSSCDLYHALPQDGQWKLYFSSPYYVTEKRLDDGKRYVFVYLKYWKNLDGSLEEALHPTGVNVTEGSFIFGAMGAIGYINEKDYEWD